MAGELMACPFLHRDNIEFPEEKQLLEGFFKKPSTHLGNIFPDRHSRLSHLFA